MAGGVEGVVVFGGRVAEGGDEEVGGGHWRWLSLRWRVVVDR